MTVRKERRQRGGGYWSVFRRCGCKLRKVYLGRSAAVTRARLQLIAEGLRKAQAAVCEEARTYDQDAPADSVKRNAGRKEHAEF